MIRIAIAGYGNLGRGVEAALRHTDDMKLAAVFTRRNPESLSLQTEGVPALPYDELSQHADTIDVVILCGGSATDLPQMTPQAAASFNVVDSFDTHADIPAHFAMADAAARGAGKVALISAGWDPGMFSINRSYAGAILPQGESYTFWGRGVSQGHSDAIRRIPGVIDARQYTIPIREAVDRARSGDNPELQTREKHMRECYVAVEDGADQEAIEETIVTMPNYFLEYETTVHFVDLGTLEAEHSGMPHGGRVIHSAVSGFENEHTQTIEYSLELGSNPEFTGSVLVAAARAVYRLHSAGTVGAVTMLDVPPALLSPLSPEEQRARLL